MGRFDRFINEQKAVVEKTPSRFENFIQPLNEGSLNAKDKSMIKTILRVPRSHTFVLDTYSKDYEDYEREIDVQWNSAKGKLTLEYNADFYELTNYLVDLCDEMGLRFDSDKERYVNTQYFTIWKEKECFSRTC